MAPGRPRARPPASAGSCSSCRRPAAWATRTQTLSVQGSTNGSSFSTVVNSAGYTFNPATGNTVTITFPATSTRYVRLNFTANTGWPAGQFSEFEVYAT